MFESIDLSMLATITGGEAPGTRTTTTGGEVDTPAGGGRIETTTTTTEPNAYLRCLDLVGRQAGYIESADNVARRQERLCGPLRGK
jgi:hypothetical protein